MYLTEIVFDSIFNQKLFWFLFETLDGIIYSIQISAGKDDVL